MGEVFRKGAHMGDLTSKNWIIAKGFMFLGIGVLASVIPLLHSPSWIVGLLLAIAVWGFCRFYYFAFYVIEHYTDSQYRFSGLFSFVRYWFRGRTNFPESSSSKDD